jgi:hypothetical protein
VRQSFSLQPSILRLHILIKMELIPRLKNSFAGGWVLLWTRWALVRCGLSAVLEAGRQCAGGPKLQLWMERDIRMLRQFSKELDVAVELADETLARKATADEEFTNLKGEMTLCGQWCRAEAAAVRYLSPSL